jgi:hypothetical protein
MNTVANRVAGSNKINKQSAPKLWLTKPTNTL